MKSITLRCVCGLLVVITVHIVHHVTDELHVYTCSDDGVRTAARLAARQFVYSVPFRESPAMNFRHSAGTSDLESTRGTSLHVMLLFY